MVALTQTQDHLERNRLITGTEFPELLTRVYIHQSWTIAFFWYIRRSTHYLSSQTRRMVRLPDRFTY